MWPCGENSEELGFSGFQGASGGVAVGFAVNVACERCCGEY